jgi:hypothetical protein
MTKKPQSRTPVPRTAKGKFVKGTPRPPNTGRAKGVRNRTTTMLKDAILTAATLVGQDGKGKDGLVGYLKMLAMRERAVYARLLEKVLPMQLHVEDKTKQMLTPEEAVAQLQQRGLPVPQSLLELSSLEGRVAIANALNDQREDGESDHLDNRLFYEPTAADDNGEDEEEDTGDNG